MNANADKWIYSVAGSLATQLGIDDPTDLKTVIDLIAQISRFRGLMYRQLDTQPSLAGQVMATDQALAPFWKAIIAPQQHDPTMWN